MEKEAQKVKEKTGITYALKVATEKCKIPSVSEQQ